MSIKPSPQLLKGFRDFLPAEKRQRDFVAGKIKTVFERYGFAPLETPTLEYAELLLGKYGQEADKLVYTFTDKGDRQVGLRYDQTVPTARVLANYQNELPKYFRRYQMQPVFRADKPQKGRYREFAQADCDIFGSRSPIADAEILAVYFAVYAELGIKSFQIQVNDRQTLLASLKPHTTTQVNVYSLIQSIDKLDKQTPTEVAAELVAKGLDDRAANQVLAAVKKSTMSSYLADIVDKATQLGVPKSGLVYNPTLARGLDYYTGLIFEGRITEYEVGSVGGGGRYDNLINDLAGVSIPAVGFGIGFDRTVEATNLLGLIPTDQSGTQVLMTVFDETYLNSSLQLATQLRQAGIATEVYPSLDKLGKQLKLADQKQIPWAVIVGETETKAEQVTLKNLKTGDQVMVELAQAVLLIKG